jgi:3-methylcrotonyl-CoA carboxylase alpha subunit
VFAKILIANRGEIACRVIRTARRLCIRTVAVYSEPDAQALHVTLADEAYAIGAAPAHESYLNIERIIAVARRSGAEAVHPGYGFLAENAEFAAACTAAGLDFIGPPASAIRVMGSKAAAKALLEKAGVPLLSGYHSETQDEDLLAKAAQRIGYPVLIKASAGGGGKGMRTVERAEDFTTAVASAKREAASAFGDDRLIIEKYLKHARHIEFQVFADRHGNTVHLFERECSIQRRYQKVVEEAPAPGMTAEQRRAMGDVAVAVARAVEYAGAGTVEFLVEGDAFYFMEMNTRLQVEHPVTEMITGQDLVEWQLRVAAGEPLPLPQADIALRGHALEARLYAEDPARDFLPAIGTLRHLRIPAAGPALRIDTGVREGDAVTAYYDPLIAKVIAWGEDRAEALRRLTAALAGYRITGLATNRDFLLRLLRHAAFVAGKFDTGFITGHRDDLFPRATAAPDVALAAASHVVLLDQAAAARSAGARSGDPQSPWHKRDGWRLNGDAYQDMRFRDGETERLVRVHERGGHRLLDIDGQRCAAQVSALPTGDVVVSLDGRSVGATVARAGAEVMVVLDDGTYSLAYIDRLVPRLAEEAVGGRLTAPMPGKVVQVLVRVGDRVKRGQALMVIEAMKMEHTIAAPADGTVDRVNYDAGDRVDEGVELIALVETE